MYLVYEYFCVYIYVCIYSCICICCCCLVMKLYLTLLQPHGLKYTRILLSMGFPRQEYWKGLPFPSLGHLPDQGIEPMSSALKGGFFTTDRQSGSKNKTQLYIICTL